MTKCDFCENHKKRGKRHSCKYCADKTIYGQLQEPFLNYCTHYKPNAAALAREEINRQFRALPQREAD